MIDSPWFILFGEPPYADKSSISLAGVAARLVDARGIVLICHCRYGRQFHGTAEGARNWVRNAPDPDLGVRYGSMIAKHGTEAVFVADDEAEDV